MYVNHFITESLRKSSSLTRYSIRAKKDACLRDDVEHFVNHRNHSVSQLVDKLINKDFSMARYTDPTYPV